MSPLDVSLTIVVLFGASWVAAALWASRTIRGLPTRDQLPLYAAGAAFMVALAAAAYAWPITRERLWPPEPSFDWAMVAVLAAGFAFCWWARLHLGRLWSGGVVLKEGHRIVDTGPYALVRHPIYTGAFLMIIGFFAIRARPAGIACGIGLIVFFALKTRIEERLLLREFGDAYEDYRRRVPRLLPRLTRR